MGSMLRTVIKCESSMVKVEMAQAPKWCVVLRIVRCAAFLQNVGMLCRAGFVLEAVWKWAKPCWSGHHIIARIECIGARCARCVPIVKLKENVSFVKNHTNKLSQRVLVNQAASRKPTRNEMAEFHLAMKSACHQLRIWWKKHNRRTASSFPCVFLQTRMGRTASNAIHD